MQRPEALLVVHAELPLVVDPVQLSQVKIFVDSQLVLLRRALTVKHSKPIEAVTLPAARVAYLLTRVVKDAIAFKFTGKVELSFIAGSILEVKIAVGLIIEGVCLLNLASS